MRSTPPLPHLQGSGIYKGGAQQPTAASSNVVELIESAEAPFSVYYEPKAFEELESVA